jgi:hypothetical protein
MKPWDRIHSSLVKNCLINLRIKGFVLYIHMSMVIVIGNIVDDFESTYIEI